MAARPLRSEYRVHVLCRAAALLLAYASLVLHRLIRSWVGNGSAPSDAFVIAIRQAAAVVVGYRSDPDGLWMPAV